MPTHPQQREFGYLFVVLAAGMANTAAAQTAGDAATPSMIPILLGTIVLVGLYLIGLRWLRRRAAREDEAPKPGRDVFSSEELERYARHIVLREIGGAGQQKLKNASVLVVGAGGLGSPALLYLAAAGIGRLAIMDDDDVNISNLQRQVIHSVRDLGRPKVESARDSIVSLNPHVNVQAIETRLDAESVELMKGYDVILDGSDSFETRQLVNRFCVEHRVPLVFGAISQWEGQICVFGSEGPCLACVFPQAPSPGVAPSCAEGGVLGALPGIIGSMMAAEAVKTITGSGQVLHSRMHIHDALWGESRTINLARNPECLVCSGFR